MYTSLLILLFNIFVITSSKEYANKLDRFLISCHTTDFECFKRQYHALRDNVLLGNSQLLIDFYEPYMFSYGDTETCVKISGIEESELVAVGMNSFTKEYVIVLELPVVVQQIRNASIQCVTPDKAFEVVIPQDGALKKFAGNATVTVTYPYTLHKKKGQIHMMMEDENVGVILDFADLKNYDKENELESKLYAWSEWAYAIVQQVDVAQHCVVPFTAQLKKVMAHLPLEKFVLLYPEEEYSELHFSFMEDDVVLEVED